MQLDESILDDVAQEVKADIRAGIGGAYGVEEVTFLFDDDGAAVFANADGAYAIAWTCRCRSDVTIDLAVPAYRTVRLDGVSILRKLDGAWVHRRYVDWNAFGAQLGGSDRIVAPGRGGRARP
jgi:hypothetical protein